MLELEMPTDRLGLLGTLKEETEEMATLPFRQDIMAMVPITVTEMI